MTKHRSGEGLRYVQDTFTLSRRQITGVKDALCKTATSSQSRGRELTDTLPRAQALLLLGKDFKTS